MLTIGQFSTIAIDSAHTVPQRVLDYKPGLGRLDQVYRPNHPTPSMSDVSGWGYKASVRFPWGITLTGALYIKEMLGSVSQYGLLANMGWKK